MGNNVSVTGIQPPNIVQFPDHLVKSFSPNMVSVNHFRLSKMQLILFVDRMFRMEQSIDRHQKKEDGSGWCLFKIQEGDFL